MKKIFLGIIAATCAAISLSSFNTIKWVNVRYFDVTANPKVPAAVSTLINSQVTIRVNPTVNPGDICVGSSYLCIVGFDTVNLTVGKLKLLPGAQPIQIVVSHKN
jgi:hypothetical protein